MARTYKRKRPRQWRDKDKRMAAAAQLRADGLSLRQIAKELAVTHPTVIADLRRWDLAVSNVVQLPVNHDGRSRPAGGNFYHSDLPSEAPVSMIQRRQA